MILVVFMEYGMVEGGGGWDEEGGIKMLLIIDLVDVVILGSGRWNEEGDERRLVLICVLLT